MNKKILMFLSLFSLVLMLSVYYVSLDHQDIKVVSVNSNVEKEIDLTSTSLQNSINNKMKEEMAKYEEQVASSKVSEADKNTALTKIQNLKDVMTLQDELVQFLKEKGYEATIEIKDQLIHISLFQQKDDKQLAKDIMDLIYQKVQGNYYLELSFK